jgi:HSP20 family molecular chaperone IbpA
MGLLLALSVVECLQCMRGQRRLPKDADPENIQSKYQDGVLIITIGKKAVRQSPH